MKVYLFVVVIMFSLLSGNVLSASSLESDEIKRQQHQAEAIMKLGEAYFRSENFPEALSQFETIARKFPDSSLVEPALFLAGKSSASIWDASGIENAMLLFEEVAKMGGPLAVRARLEQARIQVNSDSLDQALLILKNILSSRHYHNKLPDTADVYFEALIMQGNVFFNQGTVSSENYARAIQSWLQIVSDPQATPPWKNQALTKIGAAYQKLGNNDRALASYSAVFNSFDPSHPEFFWFYKAAFDAGKLLESQELWQESLRVYKQIASIPGPRAQEVQEYINSIKTSNN